jgi:glutamate-ammonia-ligase adenylyltransferase
MTTLMQDAIGRARNHSAFLRRLIDQQPELVDRLIEADFAGAMALGRAQDFSGNIGRALRLQRRAVALTVALGDLAGLLSLEQVTRSLSDLADEATDRAIAAAIEERTPGAPNRGFALLALGKHGSQELNYSSDIDPILLFDPDTLPHRPREEPVEAAVRIGRRVVELLQRADGDGYVFRVDLRLRPSPEATPIALPIEAAIGYYESSALPWERAAFIRARAAAGDKTLGENFLGAIRPFVWRRSLDYGALRELRDMSRRIRQHHAHAQTLGPGYDLKRGRGGIREAEFFAQIHQLIHGGREPALRLPATVPALHALADAERIPPEEAATLAEAYRVLRTIEHRLQMVDDQQTHRIPKQADAIDNVARLHGLTSGAELIALLRPHVQSVGRIYDSLDPEGGEGLPHDRTEAAETLVRFGFHDPDAATQRIEHWRSGSVRALRTPAALEALEAILTQLLEALGRAPNPNEALKRFDELVGRLPSAINLFRLLEAQPQLSALLTKVLSHAPALAEALGRRAELLDSLIDASAFNPPPSVTELADEFAARERGDDYQALLDQVRQRVGERRFALGVQLIDCRTDPIEVASGYARVAEAALGTLAQATIAEFESVHGRVPGGELVVLALGRLGGGALTHASDLDLVYLFSGDFMAESDGRRPLGATQYFNRLAQRVSAAMSVPTASGPLYEIDTRLRPSGVQGLLAASIDSFVQYQRENAWTWEHMALTRARPVFGSAEIRDMLQRVIEDTLHRPRDAAKLVADATKMRADIARHKPPAGPFDVKLIEGGLVDCEFAVHVQQLRHRTAFSPRLRKAAAELAEQGLLSPAVAPAHETLTRMLVTLRLVSPASHEPPNASKSVVARACGFADWDALLAAYAEARQTIGDEWRRVAGSGGGN